MEILNFSIENYHYGIRRLFNLFFTAMLISTRCLSQDYYGVKFDRFNDWNSVIEKAITDNKYIFLDIYTTWCGPCKYMDEKIFSNKEVGDFFNAAFINVKVQMDTTKNDSENIREWYKDAEKIKTLYKVSAYPTYLFFKPSGDHIHTILGSSRSSSEFLSKVELALGINKQYAFLKEEYFRGKRDSISLASLIKYAKTTGEDSLYRIFVRSYLENIKTFTDSTNISIIAESINSSTDIGFNILLDSAKVVEKIIGRESRVSILKAVAFDEEILPVIMPDGYKRKYAGGLTIYGGGTINRNVDWGAIERKLSVKYTEFLNEILLYGKLIYYPWIKDWESFNIILNDYRLNTERPDEQLIADMTLKMLEECKDSIAFEEALKWSLPFLNSKNNFHLKNYSKILYNAGKVDYALDFINKYLSLVEDEGLQNSAKEIISKMKNGDRID